MEVKTFSNIKNFSSNANLIIKDNHCLLIDCGFVNDKLISEIKKYKYFDGVVLTHGHFDHIQGLKELHKYFSAIDLFYNFSQDDFLSSPTLNVSSFFHNPFVIDLNQYNVHLIKEGLNQVGNFVLDVIYTRGHTSDGISFVIEDKLFVGDTLFYLNYGRYDFPTGNFNELNASLSKLKKIILAKNYDIYSGHDEVFTSADVLLFNEYLKQISTK